MTFWHFPNSKAEYLHPNSVWAFLIKVPLSWSIYHSAKAKLTRSHTWNLPSVKPLWLSPLSFSLSPFLRPRGFGLVHLRPNLEAATAPRGRRTPALLVPAPDAFLPQPDPERSGYRCPNRATCARRGRSRVRIQPLRWAVQKDPFSLPSAAWERAGEGIAKLEAQNADCRATAHATAGRLPPFSSSSPLWFLYPPERGSSPDKYGADGARIGRNSAVFCNRQKIHVTAAK